MPKGHGYRGAYGKKSKKSSGGKKKVRMTQSMAKRMRSGR